MHGSFVAFDRRMMDCIERRDKAESLLYKSSIAREGGSYSAGFGILASFQYSESAKTQNFAELCLLSQARRQRMIGSPVDH